MFILNNNRPYTEANAKYNAESFTIELTTFVN